MANFVFNEYERFISELYFKNEILNLKRDSYGCGYIPTTFSRYANSEISPAIPASTNPIGPNMKAISELINLLLILDCY